MSDISPSAIPEDSPELQDKIAKAASASQLMEILHNEAIQLDLVRPDPFNRQILHAVESPASLTQEIEHSNESPDATVQQWKDSVERFKVSHPVWNEFACDQNVKTIAAILETNGLANVADKDAALELAFNFALEQRVLTKTPEAIRAAEEKMATCDDFETLKVLAREASGLFGR